MRGRLYRSTRSSRPHELALRAAHDPEPARAVAKLMWLELRPPGVFWPVALEAETAAQLWSLQWALAAGQL